VGQRLAPLLRATTDRLSLPNRVNTTAPLPTHQPTRPRNHQVCEKCEKKLTKVACPEKWKDGTDKRKVNQNKLLSKDKRYTPYAASAKCKICKQQASLVCLCVYRIWGRGLYGVCACVFAAAAPFLRLRRRRRRFSCARSTWLNNPRQVHQGDGMYCHNCAYSKGLCAICGKQVLDVKSYKQSKA